jgi:hypothetical protein
VVNEDTKKSVVDEDIENLLSSGQGSTDSDNKPSIPILIVGNKIDSVSVSMQQELRQACPQQLFMVRCRQYVFIHTYIHLQPVLPL